MYLSFGVILLAVATLGSIGHATKSVMNGRIDHWSIDLLRKEHKLFKRQNEADDLDANFDRCLNIAQGLTCMPGGSIQELVELNLQCNQTQAALDSQDSCFQNSMGLFCGRASSFIGRNVNVLDIEAECLPAASSCTDLCRSLLVEISSELGCCINRSFNRSTNSLYRPEIFEFSLWSSCGVETVSDCPGNNAIVLPETMVDPECNSSVSFIRASTIGCTEEFIQPVLDILADDGNCETLEGMLLDRCGINEEDGRHCFELLNPLLTGFRAASSSCSNDTTTCSPNCRSALETLSNNTGCCLNDFFNSTTALVNGPEPFLTSQFWSVCGIETPGFCVVQFFDNGASNLSSVDYRATATVISVIMLLVVL